MKVVETQKKVTDLSIRWNKEQMLFYKFAFIIKETVAMELSFPWLLVANDF